MTDHDRAEITNGIWLCRNCHKLIDTDEQRFSAELLFAWREKHERFVLSELGNSSDKLLSEQQELLLSAFENILLGEKAKKSKKLNRTLNALLEPLSSG